MIDKKRATGRCHQNITEKFHVEIATTKNATIHNNVGGGGVGVEV